ncbi:MAG: DUF4166 domain-containing protein [Candidatus Berkiella sp.]
MNNRPRIFETVFGEKWQQLPLVFKRHYDIRAYSNDKITVNGNITIRTKGLMKWLGPLFGLMKTLAPYEAENIPITVHYASYPDSEGFHLERTFYYPDKPAYIFNSKMIPKGDNELVELTPSHMGWKMAYSYDGDRINLMHRGYILKLFKWTIPLPIEWLIGSCEAYEIALSDTQFKMSMQFIHPWFGVMYAYFGEFTF